MMNWFYKWLHKKIEKSIRDDSECEPVKMSKYGNTLGISNTESSVNSIDFTILFAEGGVVLRQSTYDTVKDRISHKMYIIPEDQDITTRVGEIVAMEILRV